MSIKLPIAESELKHIFRTAEGHVPDTPANRNLLLEVANDPAAFHGTDRYGNDWASRELPDGRQAWTQVRRSKIINGGVNTVPRILQHETGLKP